MKLTNKILLIAFAAVIIATTAFAIKLTSVVEYTPQPFKEKFDSIRKRFAKIKELEISGEYNISVAVADKDSMELFGPDLLVSKYTLIEYKNDKLKIESKVNLAKYPFFMALKLYVKNLEQISIKNGAAIQIWQMSGDSINVQCQDSSVAKINGGYFKYARIEAQGRSMISLEKAGSASFNIKDEAMLVLYADKMINSLCYKDPKTEVILNKNIKYDHAISKTIIGKR